MHLKMQIKFKNANKVYLHANKITPKTASFKCFSLTRSLFYEIKSIFRLEVLTVALLHGKISMSRYIYLTAPLFRQKKLI